MVNKKNKKRNNKDMNNKREIKEINGLNYDLDIKKAPNTNKFLTDLTNFLTELNKPENKKLLNNKEYEKVEDLLEIKFKNLFIYNYALISAFIRDEISDFNLITKMINLMILIETKQIHKDVADECMKEIINNMYIYSKFGGKEELDKKMKEKHLKND